MSSPTLHQHRTSESPEREAWRWCAQEQDQVLALRQALSLGLSRSGWRWGIGSGRWTLLVPGVAVLHSGEPTARQLRWAAVLSAGPKAALSGEAGLIELGAKRMLSQPIDVVVGRQRSLAPFTLSDDTEVRVHRVALFDRWSGPSQNVPLLPGHVCALHAAAWATTDKLAEQRLAMAVQQRLTAVPLLRDALRTMPKLHRRSLILAVLDDIELGAHALSEIEFLRFCRDKGLPLPDELQVRVRAGGTKYLDGRWTRQRVSLEVDGAHHLWVETWDADLLRSLELAAAARGSGEQLIRVSRSNLRHDGARVAELLRRLLV